MYYDDAPQASGCMRGALVIAAALLAVAGIFYFSVNNAARNLNPFGNGAISNPLAPRPTVINVDRPAVIQSIRSINRLEATTYIAEKVIEAGQQGNTFYNLFLGDKLLLIAQGEVIAGHDLSKLSDGDIVLSSDGVSVSLTLPPPEILSYKLDNEKTYVYDRERGVATRGNPNLETEARRIAEQEILRAACEGGVLERATRDGQRNIENLLKGLGFKQITVKTRPGQCPPLPQPTTTQ